MSGNPNKRHCPEFREELYKNPGDFHCALCGLDAIDPIHWPPRGLKENVLHLFGLLR